MGRECQEGVQKGEWAQVVIAWYSTVLVLLYGEVLEYG